MPNSKPWKAFGYFKNAIMLGALVVMAVACSKENTTAGATPDFDIRVTLDDLTVKKTCENDGTTGRADLFHTLRIIKSTEEDPFEDQELYVSDRVLIQIGLNESIDITPLVSSFSYMPNDGDRLAFSILVEENDTDGVQVWMAFRYEVQYDAALDCWTELQNKDCLFDNEDEVKTIFSLFTNGSWPGSPCSIDYEWKLYLQRR